MLVNKQEFNYYQEEIETRIEKEEQRRAKKKKKAQSSSKFFAIAFALLGLVLCIYILNGYSKITKLKLEIMELENEKYQLERDREDLFAELEVVKNSVKIEERAKINLGMDYPKDEQLVYLSIGETNEKEEIEDKVFFTEQIKNIINSVVGVFKGA